MNGKCLLFGPRLDIHMADCSSLHLNLGNTSQDGYNEYTFNNDLITELIMLGL